MEWFYNKTVKRNTRKIPGCYLDQREAGNKKVKEDKVEDRREQSKCQKIYREKDNLTDRYYQVVKKRNEEDRPNEDEGSKVNFKSFIPERSKK